MNRNQFQIAYTAWFFGAFIIFSDLRLLGYKEFIFWGVGDRVAIFANF